MVPLEVKKVTKFFGNFVALKDIDFFVQESEIFGIIGSNGAGKSTLIKIITSSLKPTSGNVFIFGNDNNKRNLVSKFLGVVFQEINLDPKLTTKENLLFYSILYDFKIKEAKNLINFFAKKFNFSKYLDFKVYKLSTGTQRIIELSRALLHNPKILILDEPTVGLDIESKKIFWDFVLDLNKNNKITLILTSHNLEEIKMCNRILYLQNGISFFIGPTDDFLKFYYERN